MQNTTQDLAQIWLHKEEFSHIVANKKGQGGWQPHMLNSLNLNKDKNHLLHKKNGILWRNYENWS